MGTLRWIAWTAGVGMLASCGGLASTGNGAADAAASFVASLPMGPCRAIVQEHPIEGHAHVPPCSVVDYATKPPSSGDHYPVWAAYQTYTNPIPEGFWVHDLEHGAIVISYNCPGGCDTDVTAAAAMLASLPDDPACFSLAQGVRRRSVLVPDPNLDVRFAASAWGWTLRATCFDASAFRAFALAHYNQAPEDICQQGMDPLASGIPTNCGLE